MVAMMPVAVMPPVMVMAPVVVAPMAPMTDAPRAVMGPDHRTAAVRIVIGIVIVRIVGRAVEEAAVKVMVVREPRASKPGAAMAKAAAEDRPGAWPAAMEYGTAGAEAATVKHRATAATAATAVERCGSAVKSATAMETSTTVKAAASAAVEATSATTVGAASAATSAMPTTADFGRQSARGGFRRRRRSGIDQRQCLRARWHG